MPDAKNRRSSVNAAPVLDSVQPLGRSLFSEIAAQFLAHNSLYAENPSILEFQVRVFVRAFGDVPFEEVGRDVLERFFRERRAAGIAATTCNHNRSALSVLYGWAIERGLCADNPIRQIRKFRERPKQGTVLTPEEFSSILIAAAPHLKAYLLTLLWTGGRKTETLRLKWRWFNQTARTITFVSDHAKSKRTRIVPVPDPLYRALTSLPRGGPDEPIFTYEGRPVKDMKRALATACRRAGVAPVSWHCFRRSFATWMSQNGMSLGLLQDLLGHASPTTTKKYVVPSERWVQSALEFMHPPGEPKCKISNDPLDNG